jgi:VanZ family protein
MVRRLILWVPACALMTAIFFASAIPGADLDIHIWDKALHFSVYGALGVCYLLPLTDGRWSRLAMRTAWPAVVFAMLYGITDEIHQIFTPGRHPDVRDALADTLGAAAAVGIILLLRVVVGGRRGYTAS